MKSLNIEPNPYRALNISDFSSFEIIKSAYRKLVHQHHPDKNGNSKASEEEFKKIQTAYEILETRKEEYDELLLNFQKAEAMREQEKNRQEAAAKQERENVYNHGERDVVLLFILLYLLFSRRRSSQAS
jgi:DnaJ-class molecular chaperone